MVFRRNRYYPHGDHRLTDQIDSQWIACPFTSACQTLAKHQKCSTSQKIGSTGLRLRDFYGVGKGFVPPKFDALKSVCMLGTFKEIMEQSVNYFFVLVRSCSSIVGPRCVVALSTLFVLPS